MVIHSPDAFEAKKAAAAAAAANRGRDVGDVAAGAAAGVPPSVLAASAQPPSTSVSREEEADLLGDDEQAIVHDFAAWNGDQPPGSNRAEVHGGVEKEREDVGVNTSRRGQRLNDGLTSHVDDDKISVSGSIHGVPSPATDQLNPFTPEWFAQIIGAAANAAATAAATAVAGAPRASAVAATPNLAIP